MNAEDALFGLLLEVDSIEKLDAAGFKSEYLPTEELRPIYDFAIRYWKSTDKVSAATAVVFKETQAPGHGAMSYAELLAEYAEIDIDHVPEESVEWVMEQLHGGYLLRVTSDFLKGFATDIAEADAADRGGVFIDQTDQLISLRDQHAHGLGHGSGRSVVSTPLSQIPMLATHWLWETTGPDGEPEGRLPLGSLGLLAGREGMGKSTVLYSIAAQITRGALPGHCYGRPRGVIIAATEDSYSRTIVPRLIVAGADLDMVHRVEVSYDGDVSALILPTDLDKLEEAIHRLDVAFVILDPLLSRLADNLDTHKDSDVRRALEKLSGVADRTESVVIGLIHENKGASKDALSSIMGSRAFVAVPRLVMFAQQDPDTPEQKILTLAKNNLGRTDLPSPMYTIEGAVAGADENHETVRSSRVRWEGTDTRTADEVRDAGSRRGNSQTARDRAKEWLELRLMTVERAEVNSVKRAAEVEGISEETLKRAKRDLYVITERVDGTYPPEFTWRLPSIHESDGDA